MPSDERAALRRLAAFSTKSALIYACSAYMPARMSANLHCTPAVVHARLFQACTRRPCSVATPPGAGVRWADEIVALQPQTAADGSTTIAVSSCRELRLLQLDAPPGSPLQVLRAANHSVHSDRRELWSSVAALGGADEPAGGDGWLAAGGCHGRLALFQLPPSGSSSPSRAALRPSAVLDFPGSRCGAGGWGRAL